MAGIAGPSPDELSDDLEPLFDMIIREVAPPTVQARGAAASGFSVFIWFFTKFKERW